MKKNKLFTWFFSSAFLITLGCGIGGNYSPRSKIIDFESFKVISESKVLSNGDKTKIIPIVVLNNGDIAQNPKIEWSVSDDKIAKIDDDGSLIALGVGDVVVTGVYKGEITTIDLNIKSSTGIAGDKNSNTSNISTLTIMEVGKNEVKIDYEINSLDGTLLLEAKANDVLGKEIDNLSFSWSSSDDSVAIVNSTGVVTAKSSGVTNIIATAGDKTSNIIRVTVPNGSIGINVNFSGE